MEGISYTLKFCTCIIYVGKLENSATVAGCKSYSLQITDIYKYENYRNILLLFTANIHYMQDLLKLIVDNLLGEKQINLGQAD